MKMFVQVYKIQSENQEIFFILIRQVI